MISLQVSQYLSLWYTEVFTIYCLELSTAFRAQICFNTAEAQLFTSHPLNAEA